MAGVAAHACGLQIGGTSTAVTGEAASGSGAGPWQITDATRRALDPAVVPVWYDNGVAISSGDIASVDYLFGKVTFTGSKTGPITADLSYIPLLTVARGKGFEINFETDMLDTTCFEDGADRTFTPGLKQLSVSIDTFDPLNTDMDPGGDTTSWASLFSGQTRCFLEVNPGAATQKLRAWGYVQSLGTSGEVDGLIEGAVQFSSTSLSAADGTRITYARGS